MTNKPSAKPEYRIITMPHPPCHDWALPSLSLQAACAMRRLRIASRASQAVALLLVPMLCHAVEDRLIMGGEGLSAELPSLPGEARGEQTDALHVAPESIALRDGAADGMVGMRLDNYRDDLPSLSLQKGWLVSNRLAMGGAYTVRSKASELVLNTVYATRPDARILLSVAQLRASDAAYAQNGDARTVLQTSYLSGFRKQWRKSRILPEAGMTVFVSRTAGADRRSATSDGLEMGTLAGTMLNLAARPTLRTRLELSYQAQSTFYDQPLAAYARDRQASGSLDIPRLSMTAAGCMAAIPAARFEQDRPGLREGCVPPGFPAGPRCRVQRQPDPGALLATPGPRAPR